MIPWSDITTVDSTGFKADPVEVMQRINSEKLAIKRLSPTLQRSPRLASLVVKRSVTNPMIYEKGVLGRLGNAKIFIAEKKLVPNYDRLYWVIVKTLSRQYGCFMMSRVERGNTLAVKCRDKRNIVLWRSMGKDWIQFVSRQYDANGYEIMVRNKRTIRISRKPYLDLIF